MRDQSWLVSIAWHVYNNGGVSCGGYLGEIYSASALATLQGNATASATSYVKGTAVCDVGHGSIDREGFAGHAFDGPADGAGE